MKGKLISRRGVTLSELLVTIAVLGILTVAVSSGILSSLKVYQTSKDLSHSQMLASTLSQALMDELRFAGDIVTDEEGGLLSYTSPSVGKEAAVQTDGQGQLVLVSPALAGKTSPILGSGSYAGNSAQAQITYQTSARCFAVKLYILNRGEVVRELDFYVRALNG